jgi:glycosyltransferase involved in cell wall biosynthesis
MKKKLLVLTPCLPYPAHDSRRVRVYNLLNQLSATCDIYLLSFIDSLSMREFVPELEKYCVYVHTVLRDENKRILLETIPRSLSFYYTPEMIQSVEHVISSYKPDLVQIEDLTMTHYRYHTGDVPIIYTEHDMSVIDFNLSGFDRDLPDNERFVEWTRLVQFHKDVLKTCAAVVVTSDRDKELLKGFVPGVRSWCIAQGVDTHLFSFYPYRSEEQLKRLIFVGDFTHHHNYDAVECFVKDIFPLIRAEIPDVTFDIIGSGMSRILAELEHPNIRVVGEVIDVRGHMQDAALFIAPVWIRSGIKISVLEAMSLGTVVVASPQVSEGIYCRENRTMLVAEDSETFARAVIEALRDDRLRQSLAVNARRLAEQQYDWRSLARQVDEVYTTELSIKKV